MNGTVIIKLLTIILIIPDSNRKNSETYQYSSRRILLFIFRVFRKIKPIPSLLCVCVPVRQYNLHRMVSLDANESLLLLLRLLFLYFLLVLLPYIYRYKFGFSRTGGQYMLGTAIAPKLSVCLLPNYPALCVGARGSGGGG